MIAESSRWLDPVTIATFLLALVTLGLAIATRGIARASSQEVRAMTRPMLLPSQGAAISIFQQRQPIGHMLTFARIPLRNAGSGPALNVAMAVESSAQSPWHESEFLPAVAAGDELKVDVPVFASGDRSTSQFVTFYAEYRDLSGLPYTTAMSFTVAPEDGLSAVSSVKLSQGTALFKPHFPSLKPMLSHYRRPPLRPRLRAAAGVFFLEPGNPIVPLRPRLRAAWQEIRPARRQTFLQRVRWAVRADRSNRGPGGPYAIPRGEGLAIRRRLGIWRSRLERMRWAYHEFR